MEEILNFKIMARYLVNLVKFKLGSTTYERFLDLSFGDKYEAKDVLCSQNSAYKNAEILSVTLG